MIPPSFRITDVCRILFDFRGFGVSVRVESLGGHAVLRATQEHVWGMPWISSEQIWRKKCEQATIMGNTCRILIISRFYQQKIYRF